MAWSLDVLLPHTTNFVKITSENVKINKLMRTLPLGEIYFSHIKNDAGKYNTRNL